MTLPLAQLAWDGTPAFTRSPDQWGMKGAPSTTGLTYGYIGGTAFTTSGVVTLIADGTVGLTDNTINYVERDFNGTVTANTSGFTVSKISMAKITTASGVISAFEDRRVRHSVPDPGLFTPQMCGGVGDGSHDDTTPIQNAINAAAVLGGVVYLPPGTYKTTAPITLPAGVRLKGANATAIAPATTYNARTVIVGTHTGVAIIDMRGTQGASIVDLKLYGSVGAVPKTGLLLGRTSAASAGFHFFSNVSVEGYFSVAPVYSIASEENIWIRPHISLLGGGAKYCFYTSQGDGLSVGGLTGSSNIKGELIDPWFANAVNDATSSVIYMDAGAGTFAWTVTGGYLLPKSGAYVTINVGVDAADCPGPITFIGTSGEISTGGLNPISGFNLTSGGVYALRGLVVLGCKFAIDAAGYFIRQGASLRIKDALVRCSNMMGVGSSMIASQITNSIIDVGNSTAITLFGDLDVSNGVYGIRASADNTKGYSLGAVARIRLQSVANEVQLVTDDASAFYAFAAKEIHLQGGAANLLSGTGSPAGAVTAPAGSLFLRTDGGASTTLYVKESGSGNTGWVGK